MQSSQTYSFGGSQILVQNKQQVQKKNKEASLGIESKTTQEEDERTEKVQIDHPAKQANISLAHTAADEREFTRWLPDFAMSCKIESK